MPRSAFPYNLVWIVERLEDGVEGARGIDRERHTNTGLRVADQLEGDVLFEHELSSYGPSRPF